MACRVWLAQARPRLYQVFAKAPNKTATRLKGLRPPAAQPANYAMLEFPPTHCKVSLPGEASNGTRETRTPGTSICSTSPVSPAPARCNHSSKRSARKTGYCLSEILASIRAWTREKPFEQMQQAGMRTSHLDQIVRQKDPALLRAVEHLSRNDTGAGVHLLQQQGRITEIPNHNERIDAIAKGLRLRALKNTLIVSPDNASRRDINGRRPRRVAKQRRCIEREPPDGPFSRSGQNLQAPTGNGRRYISQRTFCTTPEGARNSALIDAPTQRLFPSTPRTTSLR